MNPTLNRDAFADALRKGHGRASAHIRQHGDAGIEDLLLDACIRSYAYDPQIEGHRGGWMMEMLDALPDATRYYAAVLPAFARSAEYHDVAQMSWMLRDRAERGDTAARAALYARFDRQEFDEWIIGPDIVSLDGVDGLLHVARVMGRRLAADADFRIEARYWLDDQLGATVVEDALAAAGVSDEDVRRFHAALTEEPSSCEPRLPLDLEGFLAAIDQRNHPHAAALRFARDATNDELRQLLDIMVAEPDADRLVAMMRTFRRRPLPEAVVRLLPMARSDDMRLRRNAIAALSNQVDPRIAELSGDLLAADSLDGVELMERNFDLEQFNRVLALLPSTGDPEDLHRLGMHLLDVAKGRPEAQAALLWIYENTPCSFCRLSALQRLTKFGDLPEAIAAECRDDCNHEIRELVA